MKWPHYKLLLALLFCFHPSYALIKMALVIGNNTGMDDEKPLQYATRDAKQIYETLGQLGGMDKGKSYLLLDLSVAKVMTALREASNRIQTLHKEKQKVQLLIYFSGHGSEDALHLNGEKLPIAQIREYFTSMDADLKILIADACYSGSLIQAKGAKLGAVIPVKYSDELKVNGSAILTSSSAGELSQESQDFHGSIFTHYFLTAMRGAADFDRDGQITLWEAYNYTQLNLRRKSMTNKGFVQNPGFDIDVNGSDNVILTHLDLGQALLSFKGFTEGQYQILEANSTLQVAEIDLSGGEGVTLALPKANYLVYRSSQGKAWAVWADLRQNKITEINPSLLYPISMGALAAKGGDGGLEAKGLLIPREINSYHLALHSRLYPYFPGRKETATSWMLSAESQWETWSFLLSGSFLPTLQTLVKGNRFTQTGYSIGGELRYYFYPTHNSTWHLGPHWESWFLQQNLNGKTLGQGNLLGTMGSLGADWIIFHRFTLGFNWEPGIFLHYDKAAILQKDFASPISIGVTMGLW